MIFQIDYHSGGQFDSFFADNINLSNKINHKVFGDIEVDNFLNEYGYHDIFHSKNVLPRYKFAEMAIRCDFLRLMILYELGGIYIDADSTFTDKIVDLETDLVKNFGDRDVLLTNRSLFFVKSKKKSKYIKHLLDVYINSDILTVDVGMIQRHQLSKYHKDLMLIHPEYIQSYFTYLPITGKYD